MSDSFEKDLYSGAQSFGKIRAVFGVIFGTLFGIIAIIAGILLIKHKKKRTSSVIGNVVDQNGKSIPIQCISTVDENNNSMYNCNFQVSYSINNQNYSHPFNTSSIYYNGLSQVTLYYDPDSPGDVSLDIDDYHKTGYIFIGIGIFILISSWVYLWIIMKYKFAAAANGVAGAAGLIAKAF
jgi:hypothetical protein